MKTMVPFAKARTRQLEQIILDHVTPVRAQFEVSDPKSDGTVVVKFRSSTVDAASELSQRFCEALSVTNIHLEKTDDCRFRLRLAQLSVPCD